MTALEEQMMVENAMIVMSGDMFQKIYDKLGEWTATADEIRYMAREFVSELKWKGEEDERDWIIELQRFEDKEFEKL